jgi:hypothetical protein
MFALTTQMAPDVIVLGAGFSRAVSEVMPDTDGLGDAVLERLGNGAASSRTIY